VWNVECISTIYYGAKNLLQTEYRGQSVHVSVCLLVTFVSRAKTSEPIEMKFGVLTRMGAQRTTYYIGVEIAQGEEDILGPIEKHWETLLWCTQKRLNRPFVCLFLTARHCYRDIS